MLDYSEGLVSSQGFLKVEEEGRVIGCEKDVIQHRWL